MKHLGDFDASTVVYGKFTTFRPSTGAAYTLAGTPALSVYKDNSTTQSTTGVTLTADFDSVTGLNHFAIDTSADGTFYSAGSFFDIVITTGTVDSVSVVGSVVASFTIRKNSALKPTTAGRALDVSAGGEAGVDWANVGSPTTPLNLSGTTIATTQKVDVETIKTQSVTCAAGVTVLASVGTAATSTAQTGDAYAIVNNGTHGNAALKALIDAVDNFVDTEVAAIKTVVDAIQAKTDNLPTDPADASDIAAALAALNDISAAEVNAEMVDALNVDTYGETSGVPATSATLVAKISRMYDALKNGLDVTASKKQFKNAAGTVQWEKDLSDDGTTYSESAGNAP